MTTIELQQQIMQDLQQASFDTLMEVWDFLRFLKSKPVVKQTRKCRQFGSAKGMVKIADDFDEPLADFQEYME